MESNQGSDLMTVKQVASYFQVSKATVYNWIQDGKIISYDLNGSLRFKRKEIEQVVKQRITNVVPAEDIQI